MTHIDTSQEERCSGEGGASHSPAATPSPTMMSNTDQGAHQMPSVAAVSGPVGPLPERRHSLSGRHQHTLKNLYSQPQAAPLLNDRIAATFTTPPTSLPEYCDNPLNASSSPLPPTACDLSPPTPTSSSRRKSLSRSNALYDDAFTEFPESAAIVGSTNLTHHYLPAHKTSIVTLPDQTKLLNHVTIQHNQNSQHRACHKTPSLPPIGTSSVPHLSTAIMPPNMSSDKPSNGIGLLKPPEPQVAAGHLTHQSSITMAPIPPDGGWGWVVVFASFMIHVIADGITYSFGVFHKELLQDFRSSNALTAWVASIMTGMTLCIGPIASGLTNRYGCRAVTIAGAVLCAAGLASSTAATTIQHLFLTIGVMAGAGFGLMYLPAIVSVTCYFERRRATATGIAVCGSGIGSAIFAPIIEWLIHRYKWRGAMLIVSAVVLNCAALGALFRPLKSHVIVLTSPAQSRRVTQELSNEESVKLIKDSALLEPSNKIEEEDETDDLPELDQIRILQSQKPRPSISRTTSSPPISPIRHHSLHGAHHVKLLVTDNDHDVESSMQNGGSHLERAAYSMDEPHGHNPLMIAAMEGQGHHNPSAGLANGTPASGARRRSITMSPSLNPSGAGGILSRKDIFYSGSLVNIPQYRSNPKLYSVSMTSLGSVAGQNVILETKQNGRHSLVSTAQSQIISKLVKSPSSTSYSHHAVKDNQDLRSKLIRRWFKCSEEMWCAMRAMTDLTILSDAIFVLFAVSNFLTSIGFFVPNLFVADRVLKINLVEDPERASYLLAAIGLGSSAGRLIFGSLSDRRWVNRLWLYASSLTICGCATMGSIMITQSYTGMVLYCLIFGLSCGTFVSLTSVLLVDLLGLEKLTNSFGLLLLFQGVASLIGPPIIGWLYDATGSYDDGFLLAGSLIAASGLILLPIPRLQRWIMARSRKSAVSH